MSIVKVELPSKEAAAAESSRLKRSEFPDVSIRESEGMSVIRNTPFLLYVSSKESGTDFVFKPGD